MSDRIKTLDLTGCSAGDLSNFTPNRAIPKEESFSDLVEALSKPNPDEIGSVAVTVAETTEIVRGATCVANTVVTLLKKYPVDKTTGIRRVSSLFMDCILGWAFKVHDHGFVRVIDYMGDDSSIVQAARVSYGKGTKTKLKDASLISYLIENAHTSPLEMVRIKLHIKLPIFVARQWIRHRMSSVNEYSGRYSVMGCEYYLPDDTDIAGQSDDNKQARGDGLTPEQKKRVIELLTATCDDSVKTYDELLSEDVGLARELARIGLTLNTYTEMYWTIDLHNLINFIRLRLHPHAQKEIRDYAQVIWDIIEGWLPTTAKAAKNFVLDSKRLSGAALTYLQMRISNGGRPVEKVDGMSRREKDFVDGMFDDYKPTLLQRTVSQTRTILTKMGFDV